MPLRLPRAAFQWLRNVVKYRLLHDLSIRSDLFGREHMADLATRFIQDNDVRGSYLEFGLFRGSTFAQFYRTFRRRGLTVPMYGFDSFEGMPEAAGPDAADGFKRFARARFLCSREDLVAELAARGVPPAAYVLVPGFYQDSLVPGLYEKFPLAPAAIVWVDSLYYASAQSVLTFVAPLLQDGTVLAFTSYYRFKAHPGFGERRAIAEFLAAHRNVTLTEYARFGSTGLTLIAHILGSAIAG
jgi:O-methyltransferase